MNIFGVEVADPITPNIGGFNVNPVNLLTGTGTPIVPVNTPMTPEERAAIQAGLDGTEPEVTAGVQARLVIHKQEKT